MRHGDRLGFGDRWCGATVAVRVVVATALSVALVGCGGEEPDEVAASPTPVPTDTASTTPSPTTRPTSGPTSTDPVAAESDVGDDGSTPAETASGTPIELPFGEGDVLAVIGVAADDLLNVRSGPGVDQTVVGTLTPLAVDVTVMGNGRQLPGGGIWAPVEAGDVDGWVNTSFLAFVGSTDDTTSRLLPLLDDDGRAERMLDLGRAVADLRASSDPPSTITVVDGPTVGDLGEVTLDVVGLGDDSIRGVRLHVFATPEDGGGFGLKSVEETTLCARGVTGDGQCI